MNKKPCEHHLDQIHIKGWKSVGGDTDTGGVSVCRECGEIYMHCWKGDQHVQVWFHATTREVLDAIAQGVYDQ